MCVYAYMHTHLRCVSLRLQMSRATVLTLVLMTAQQQLTLSHLTQRVHVGRREVRGSFGIETHSASNSVFREVTRVS